MNAIATYSNVTCKTERAARENSSLNWAFSTFEGRGLGWKQVC